MQECCISYATLECRWSVSSAAFVTPLCIASTLGMQRVKAYLCKLNRTDAIEWFFEDNENTSYISLVPFTWACLYSWSPHSILLTIYSISSNHQISITNLFNSIQVKFLQKSLEVTRGQAIQVKFLQKSLEVTRGQVIQAKLLQKSLKVTRWKNWKKWIY